MLRHLAPGVCGFIKMRVRRTGKQNRCFVNLRSPAVFH